MAGGEVLGLLEGVDDLYVAKGRKVVHFALAAERPADEELTALLCGRSGKLRAPALRSGNRLLVGYNAEILAALLRPEG